MAPTSLPVRVVKRFAGRLRFPTLFFITAAVFGADLVFPDVIPFVDEILLGLATVLLGAWKERDGDSAGQSDDDVETTGSGP